MRHGVRARSERSRALLARLGMAMGLAACAPVTGAGQFTDPIDGRFDASQYLAKNAFGVLPVPIVITEPAVEGGLGSAALFFHESEDQSAARRARLQENPEAPAQFLTPSVSAVAGAYTGNGSWFVGGGHFGVWKDGRVRYQGGGGYGDVRLDFYGSGDEALDTPIELRTRAFGLLQSLKFKLGQGSFFAGVSQRLVDARVSRTNSVCEAGFCQGRGEPPTDRSRFTDADVRTSALGVVLEYDTRDNLFSPHSGLKYKAEHLWYADAFGSDIDYELTELSALNYFVVSDRWRTAVRLDAKYADSDQLLPQFATPTMVLRGIPAARYQGLAVGVVEAELTYVVDPRWSINAFAGLGRAANAFDELGAGKSRTTRGAGFRYLLARRYGLEFGADLARGPEDTIFYIQAGTAW